VGKVGGQNVQIKKFWGGPVCVTWYKWVATRKKGVSAIKSRKKKDKKPGWGKGKPKVKRGQQKRAAKFFVEAAVPKLAAQYTATRKSFLNRGGTPARLFEKGGGGEETPDCRKKQARVKQGGGWGVGLNQLKALSKRIGRLLGGWNIG